MVVTGSKSNIKVIKEMGDLPIDERKQTMMKSAVNFEEEEKLMMMKDDGWNNLQVIN